MCDPSIKMPYCGRGNCMPPAQGEAPNPPGYIKPEGNATTFDPPEKVRTYYFAKEGQVYPVTFKGVTKLTVRSSGTHRIETADGKFYIVPAGWLYIELDIEGWTK
jgi:hypothetical protein